MFLLCQVSRRLLSALCCCRLKTDYVKGKPVPPSGSLAWLPQRLERLKIETTIVLDWGTCPVLPRLRNLDMQKLLSPPPPLLSPHFPSLEVVSVKTERAWVGPDFDVAALFEDLEGLPNIREVNVAMSGELLDFNGPPGCRVNMKFSLNYFPQFDEGQVNLPAVPAGLASHLKSMQIRFGFFESEGNTKLDLGNFGECGVLSRLCLELIEGEAIFGDLLVHGLDILPASCRSVVLRKAQDGLPFVLPAPGWQIFPGLSDIEVELRRV